MKNNWWNFFNNSEKKERKFIDWIKYDTDWTTFNWSETDENGIIYYYENGKLQEKNFYTKDGKLITEEWTFDESWKLLFWEIKYLSLNNESEEYILDKVVKVNRNFKEENETKDTKIKVEQIINDQKEDLDISENEMEVIKNLTDSEKSSILNEIHIKITEFIRNKENRKNPFSKDLRHLYNEFKTDPENFLKFYSKWKNTLEKAWIKVSFLKDFEKEKPFKNLTYSEYVEQLEIELSNLAWEIYENIDKNFDFIYDEFIKVKKSSFLNKMWFPADFRFRLDLQICLSDFYSVYEKMFNGDFWDYWDYFRKNLIIIKSMLNDFNLFDSLKKINELNFDLEKKFNEKMKEYCAITLQR